MQKLFALSQQHEILPKVECPLPSHPFSFSPFVRIFSHFLADFVLLCCRRRSFGLTHDVAIFLLHPCCQIRWYWTMIKPVTVFFGTKFPIRRRDKVCSSISHFFPIYPRGLHCRAASAYFLKSGDLNGISKSVRERGENRLLSIGRLLTLTARLRCFFLTLK